MSETHEARVDKYGRIVDAAGRPLRDRSSRTYGSAPYMGKGGNPHPNQERLDARIKSFETVKHKGYKKPGSLKK